MIDNKQIGKLKLEYEIKRSIFITGKTYYFVTKDGDYINKAKEVRKNSLKYEDYIALLNNVNVKTSIKTQSKTDWSKGFVKIEDIAVTVSSDSYKKRNKIYKEKEWIETTPFCINEIGLSLILYQQTKTLELIKIRQTQTQNKYGCFNPN